MRWNPIVKKDLQVTARSMRLSWGLFAYDVILVLGLSAGIGSDSGAGQQLLQ